MGACMSKLKDLDKIAQEAERAILDAVSLDALEEVRRTYLGRRGIVAQLFDRVPSLPAAQRPQAGRRLNEIRDRLQDTLTRRGEDLQRAEQGLRLADAAIDVTLPGRRIALGRQHVLTRTLEEIERIFFGMGFEIVDGTEVETDEFNFERLNMGRDHPARDAQDSFYLTDDLLLRTHTTVVDARVMVGRTPPMRILTTGRCYRRDAPDATHMPVFHQADGFMVGERITMADLKGVLATFVRQMFGVEAVYRFVPSYFPFTEPSAELAVWFNGRWLELAGSGMFHPRVLELAGIDPVRHTAFAFGLGIGVDGIERSGGDAVFDLEIAANRGDLMSHLGVARELAAATRTAARPPAGSLRADSAVGSDAVRVEVREPALCPRFTAALIADVTVGPPPDWMARRLEACGIRSINNVVDVTNYVMLELGQPMHAFDYDQVQEGRLVVRQATPGERLTTLDGVDRLLDPQTLVVADAGRAASIAGIVGGASTEIRASTRRVLLEAASWHPPMIRRTNKRLA